MEQRITDIKHIDQQTMRGGLMSPTMRKFIQHVDAEVQRWIDGRIHDVTEADNFQADDILIDWERGEITAKAGVSEVPVLS